MIIILIFFSMIFSISTHAETVFKPMFRGARAQAMGNAFTAVADDYQAIFYNPAGLAGIQDFSINIASLSAEISNDLTSNYNTLSTAFANTGITTGNTLIGKNLSTRIQANSAIVMPKFGFAAFADEQIAIRLQNPVSPQGEYGAQTTYGFQGGFGTDIHKFKRKRGILRFGIAGKMLWRAGGFTRPTANDIMSFNTGSLIGNYQTFTSAIGVDAGFQYIKRFKKKFTLQAGLAMTDIGTTTFTYGADPQYSNLTFGLAATYRYGDLNAIASADYAHLFESIDWAKKTHFGLELKFPVLSLYGGLNQLYPTYGFGINLGLVRLIYTSYAEELSVLSGQNGERRNLVYLSIKLGQ